MKLLKKIFTSKIVLYLLAIYSMFAILGFLMLNQIENLTFFLALGYLSSYFSKNMIINFLVAILGTNVWASSVREGFKEGHDSEVGHAHLDEEDEEKVHGGHLLVEGMALDVVVHDHRILMKL